MQQQHGAVIGRDGDVREVVDALCATGDAARVLLITAEAGMGKTAVVEQARRAAAQDGAVVVRLGWEDEDIDDTHDAIVIDSGCGLFVEAPDGCLPPLTLARRARLRAAARKGQVTGLSAFSEALTETARQTPFALVVDGIERMPPHSAEALVLLLRISRPRGVPVVMAGRPPPAADPGRAQLTAAADQILHLPPLRPADVATLVSGHITRRFGRPAEPALADAVSRALGTLTGNPRAVLSVLDTLDEQDLLELDGRLCLTLPEKHLRLTTELAESLGFGRPRSPAGFETVWAAILAAHGLAHAEVHVDDVSRLTPSAHAQHIERTLDRLVADRILTVDQQGRVSFAVPALAAALRTLPDRCGVQSLHARLVAPLVDRLGAEAAGGGYPRLADHVAAAGPRLDDALAVPLLLAAAREDARTNWPRSARAYAAALHRLAPQDGRTPGVLNEASSLSLRHGDTGGLLALGEPLLACLDLAHTDITDITDTAEDIEGIEDTETPAGLEAVASAWVWAAVHEHRSPYADDTDPRYRAALEPFPAATGLAALGGVYGIGPLPPRPAPTADPAANAAPDTGPGPGCAPLPSPAELHLMTAAVGSHTELRRALQCLPPGTIDEGALDRLRNAAAYADLAGALAAVLGDRYTAAPESIAVQYRGMVHDYLAGDWEAALVGARRIEVRSRTHGAAGVPHLARALAAEIHCMRGDVARAQAWLCLIPDTVTHPLAARARLAVRYRSGREDEALEGAWHDARQARKSGRLAGVERVLLRILSLAAHEGRPQTVRQALEELETLHEEAATPMTHEALLMARGIAHHDVDSALTADRLLKSRGDVYLSVISSLGLARIADDSRSWLTEAMRSAQNLALGRPFRSAVNRVAQLRDIPVPRLRQPNDELTELDIRLARMVSDGATNRQIAAELACSHKTVEQRLTRLFQRTGCRSRTELTAAWLNGSLTRRGPLSPDTPTTGARTAPLLGPRRAGGRTSHDAGSPVGLSA
ncbi:AAA family ATPase [Streptomyces sp. DSM 118878]